MIKCVQEYQNIHKNRFNDFCSLSITNTDYVAGDYTESGYCIGLINYPRFPKPAKDIVFFTEELVKFLLDKLKQSRITVVYCNETVLYESEYAQNYV